MTTDLARVSIVTHDGDLFIHAGQHEVRIPLADADRIATELTLARWRVEFGLRWPDESPAAEVAQVGAVSAPESERPSPRSPVLGSWSA